MARYSGNIGYIENKKIGPGKWVPEETVRHYYGDVTRAVRKLTEGQDINNNITIDHQISIVADPYAREHFFAIRYAEWQGVKWKVESAEIVYPRIILSLGGMYNGST